MKSEVSDETQIAEAAPESAKGRAASGSASSMLAAFSRRGGATILLFVLVLVVTAVVSPMFFRINNLSNVALEASIVGVVAVGMTFVILSGGIDLSVGSVLAVTGVASAMLTQSGQPAIVAVLVGLLIGAALGLANGLGVTVLAIPPFVMTLAILVIGRGLALRISNGSPQAFTTDDPLWSFLGNGKIGPVPGPLVVFVTFALVAWVVLTYTPFGRQVYALGGNAEVARFSGVRVTRVRIGVYVISGITAAVAGAMTTAQLSVGAPTAGNLMELLAIAAVVIGGTSLLGGIGGIGGTVLGAFMLAILANLLNLLGVGPFDQQIARGAIIIIAVVVTSASLRARGGASTS